MRVERRLFYSCLFLVSQLVIGWSSASPVYPTASRVSDPTDLPAPPQEARVLVPTANSSEMREVAARAADRQNRIDIAQNDVLQRSASYDRLNAHPPTVLGSSIRVPTSDAKAPFEPGFFSAVAATLALAAFYFLRRLQ